MKRPVYSILGLLLAGPALAQQPAVKPDSAQAPVVATAAVPGASEMLECSMLSGRVTNAFNYPLTGATVMLRSRDKSFSTDAFSTNSDGQYLLTSKKPIPRNTVLLITAAGYTSVEQPLLNCKPLDITLELLPGTRLKSDGRIKKTTSTGKIR